MTAIIRTIVVTGLFILVNLTVQVSAAAVSDKPDTPFKLASFEKDGDTRVGMVLDDNIIDIISANEYLIRQEGVTDISVPAGMKQLIESYDRVRPRLYQLANYLQAARGTLDFVYPLSAVRIEAPIKYPWNLLATAVNYRKHAAEMGSERTVDPDRDAPYLFAKSPRSAIADPGVPYRIPAGRNSMDWEAELAVVIGKQSKNLTLDNAADSIFGFTIMYDVSDRAPQFRQQQAYNVDWFSAKSRDGAAPMGPYIVPKEFIGDYADLDIKTWINDQVMQDSNTSYMIYSVEHLLRYVTSIMTLFPGDVIATGTPDGVGAGRKPPVFLKPGDVVRISIEGIGTLETPIVR